METSESSHRPIGVFDSGIGGLTVLRALSRAMPGESFVYLGDVARLPYGTKSKSVVESYVRRCVDFLARQNVRMVVIACNTATAMALEEMRAQKELPIYGVIEPGVQTALRHFRGGKFLVLATQSTVKSEAYLKEFRRQNPKACVDQIACPLLVPLAEEGWFDHPVTVSVIRNYLKDVKIGDYDAVVLGCTHYPLLEPSFRQVVGDAVPLVHSGEALAAQISGGKFAKADAILTFFSTDPIDGTIPIISRLFDGPISFDRVDL